MIIIIDLNLKLYLLLWIIGVRDRSADYGAPPMQLHQQIDNMVAKYNHMRGLSSNTGAPSQNNKKRKRVELDREEQDMEVDEDG